MYSSVPEFSTEQNKKPLNVGFSFMVLGTRCLLPTLSGRMSLLCTQRYKGNNNFLIMQVEDKFAYTDFYF